MLYYRIPQVLTDITADFLLVPDRWTTAEVVTANQSPSSPSITTAGTTRNKASSTLPTEEVEHYISGSTQPVPPQSMKAFLPMTTAS